ncbi:MAG: hypothetical protein U1E89_04265 [Burkholderiaceae bacterium]
MKLLYAIVLAVLFGAPSKGQAAEFWSDATALAQLYPFDGGVIFFSSYANPMSTCGGTRWFIPTSLPNYKVLVATLMFATAQGSRIQFHVNDQPPSCEPVVDRFVVLLQ